MLRADRAREAIAANARRALRALPVERGSACDPRIAGEGMAHWRRKRHPIYRGLVRKGGCPVHLRPDRQSPLVQRADQGAESIGQASAARRSKQCEQISLPYSLGGTDISPHGVGE
jgi:hypothetical protein